MAEIPESDMGIIVEAYMEKIFYYCLKKVGSTAEAEDLSSDIMLNIIDAISRNGYPDKLSAYIWKIARNRYSVWAQNKRVMRNTVLNDDISAFELTDKKDFFNELLYEENISLMRRELAFTLSDYRSILIAHYIDNRSIKDIAEALKIPQSTVKTKLYRCRKNLKEGMEVAREFGKRSYNPEEITFVASGEQPSGLPWSAVHRKAPKNILLEASNNPLTVEELSMELGIAMPYMEEEVNLLHEATLLKKIGNKYITNFFIADKECQLNMYNALRVNSQKRSSLIDKISEDMLAVLRKLNTVRNDMTDDEIKWFAVLRISDYFISMLNGVDVYFPGILRENGERWGFTGYEKAALPENCISGHNGTCTDGITTFWHYNISDYGMWMRAGRMEGNEVSLLGDIIRNRRNIKMLSSSEKIIWNRIDGRFAHTDLTGNVIPDILVFEGQALDTFKQKISNHCLYDETVEEYKKAHRLITDILNQNNNKVLQKQSRYYATAQMYDVRMMTVRDEVKAGRLKLPQDPNKSTIAMYLEVK